MPYHLENTQLRVVREYVCEPAHREVLKATRFIILEHILPTTEQFVNHVSEAGAEIFAIVAKPYSIDSRVLSRIEESGLRVIRKTYDVLIPMKVVTDSDLIPVSDSDVMPVAIGAQRRWPDHSGRSDRHPSTGMQF